MNSVYFPSIQQIINALVKMFLSGQLFTDLTVSTKRVFLGFALGTFLGVCVGLATAVNKLINDLLGPILHFLRYLPLVALVPLSILWFGIGEFSKISIITIAVFFPVWLNTHSGINHINKKYLFVAKNLELKFQTIVLRVLLPGALPTIFNGIRLGLGYGFVLLVIAEMAGAYAGLGFRIDISYLLFRVDKVLALLLFLGVIGILSDRLLVLLGKNIFPWLRSELK